MPKKIEIVTPEQRGPGNLADQKVTLIPAFSSISRAAILAPNVELKIIGKRASQFFQRFDDVCTFGGRE